MSPMDMAQRIARAEISRIEERVMEKHTSGRFNALYRAALNLGMSESAARFYAAEAMKSEVLQRAAGESK